MEWQVAASLETPMHTADSQDSPSSSSTPPTADKSESQIRHPNAPDPKNGNQTHVPRIPLTPIPVDASLAQRTQERDRGPLTPDHLREALRRYKKDKEGVVGFGGLSLEGRERTASRMGGKRLFK
jgi:transcription initiation factor TFIID subunit 11